MVVLKVFLVHHYWHILCVCCNFVIWYGVFNNLRIFMEEELNKPSSELLQPVNLVLSVRRNLAATWYHKMAALEVDGDLKPMEVSPYIPPVHIC